MTDALHLKAIGSSPARCAARLPATPARGSYGARPVCGGMGFSNVGLGRCTVWRIRSALYNTPHGVANAILLPHVMRFNAEATGEKYRDIARAMGVRVEALSLTAARGRQ